MNNKDFTQMIVEDNNKQMEESTIIQKSIECLANAKINNTTYEIARDIVLDFITNLQENNQTLQREIAKAWQENQRLMKENKRLKEELTLMVEDDEKSQETIIKLSKEIKRLKETNVYCNRTDCGGRIKDSRKYDSLYQEKEDYKSRIDKALRILENDKVAGSLLLALDQIEYTLRGGEDE